MSVWSTRLSSQSLPPNDEDLGRSAFAGVDLTRAEAERLALAHECWHEGDLEYLLHADQRQVRALIRQRFSGAARRFVLEIARRWGKSILLVALCCEAALGGPKRRIVYGAPTLKLLAEFVHPAFDIVCRDAPEDCRPVWNEKEGHYNFPNGSWIHLFGADDERAAKRGRGGDAYLVVFDEAGFTDVLSVVLKDVFRPALQLSEGQMILSSSPADRPDHEFTQIAELEEAAGNYANRSWLDNPLLDDERRARELAELAREAGMTPEEYIKTPTYQREYMGKRVVDPLLVAVPEWAAAEKECTIAIVRPKLFRAHVSLDWGGNDPHAALFGYWHLEHGLVIEDELLLRADEVTTQFNDAVKAKERELWGVDTFDGTLEALADATLAARFEGRIPAFLRPSIGRKGQPQPFLRIADHNLDLVRAFYEVGLACIPADKPDKQLGVQRFRVLVLQRKLKVNPRCVHFLRHLRQTTWKNHDRREWARKGGEHGDLLDCGIYMTADLNRDVPLEPTPQTAPLMFEQARAILGNSPMANKLLRGRR